MPVFNAKSKGFLAQAHPDLQKVMNEAIKSFDFAVYCGYRNMADQNKAKREGKSRASFGQSPHNFKPSFAVDIHPVPLNWNDIRSFEAMGEAVLKAAKEVGVNVTWGRDFKGLVDYPHFELTGWRNMKGNKK